MGHLVAPLQHTKMNFKIYFFLFTLIVACYGNIGFKRAVSFFNIVKFPNDICNSSEGNRNGTCYTKEECSQRNGLQMGTYAEGYGVCCIITLSCGGTSSDNCTYLIQESTSSPTTPCSYKICSANKAICRIRFDFIQFDIEGPTVPSGSAAAEVDGNILDCAKDTFRVSSRGFGTPVICGTNANQHLYVDTTNGNCVDATFQFDASTTTSRQWDIKVTQYTCDEELAGPPGCLQYHIATTGTVASFNYPIGSTSLSATGTDRVAHLNEQQYNICFRRASGNCAICFTPSIVSTTNVASYGLGNVASATDRLAVLDTSCSEDYLVIPGGYASGTIATTQATTLTADGIERICGRTFTTDNTLTLAIAYSSTGSNSICTIRRPFMITFHTNDNEVVASTSPDGTNSEETTTPQGIIGFSLDYKQIS